MKTKTKNISQIELLIEKIKVATKIISSPDLYKTVGSEWQDDEYSHGIKHRRIKGVSRNRETTTLFVDALKNAVVSAHYHEQTELLLCLKGEVFFPIQGKTITANQIYIMKPKEIHEIHFKEDSELIINWSPCFSSMKEVQIQYHN